MTIQKIKEEIVKEFSELYKNKSYLKEWDREPIYVSFIQDSLTRLEEAMRERGRQLKEANAENNMYSLAERFAYNQAIDDILLLNG